MDYFFFSFKGGASTSLPTYASCFTSKITSLGLRWGKTFSTPDPVHIDFPINSNLQIFQVVVQGLLGC